MEEHDGLRQLQKGWNYWMIAAAMVVSFLGTFTSTQLMIQARLSARVSSVITWILLASLTFGFCAVWSLHFVCMLACKLDLPIGLDAGWTLFSAVLAVMFTFASMGADLLWESHRRKTQQQGHSVQIGGAPYQELANAVSYESIVPLLGQDSIDDSLHQEWADQEVVGEPDPRDVRRQRTSRKGPPNHLINDSLDVSIPEIEAHEVSPADKSRLSSTAGHYKTSESRNSSSAQESHVSIPRLDNLEGMAFQGSTPSQNAFVAILQGVYAGMSWKAILMGLVWSLSLICMHYAGLGAMQIPGGYLTLNPTLVLLSALISWLVCIVGYIYMIHIEPHLSQQILFSVTTALGIAAMHFTGMRATTFWSLNPPAAVRGYPPQLPVAVCSIAILTCMLANGLLAHSATVSRNKLAEIVWTRRRLWRTIAQKENAEAAVAARSNFIASASHEIRTPLHHLQGYCDLLSRTELSDEGRQLLFSIERATKTLLLSAYTVTNNVLDWSKLESDRDALCRPIPLDIRSVSESILVLLPNNGDEAEVEVMVVVAPDVPNTLVLDETYIHRILMNLLSNALKFTKFGYVMLSLEMSGSDLVAKVTDTGTGVPPSFLNKLFEPFSQAQTRGSQRGTGLGLSIVKQLLNKMEGIIAVESRHADQGYSPDETGTTFTVTIPAQLPNLGPSCQQPSLEVGLVAVLHPIKARVLDGLKMAWELFGCKVVVVKQIAELSNVQIRYIWADSTFLQQHPEWLQQLINQEQFIVLVPFEHQDSLQQLHGLLSAPHFVPLQKPVMWHTILGRIAIASHASSNIGSSRPLGLDSTHKAIDRSVPGLLDGSMISKNVNILLVEDNTINQKLGTKMLTSLGYSVLLARDGDEAISQTLKYDRVIDIILMDQSMPIKDGITATREIRALESAKKLSRRHPIIALTAVVGTESRAQFKDAGADEFLAKPLSMGKLEQTLATFLRVE